MPVIFTSQYTALAHGAVNWDTQLRNDITAIGGAINGAINLPNGSNLNGYNFQGVYFGTGLVNAPLGVADAFLVQCLATLDGAGAVQIAHRLTTGSFSTYRRYYVNGVGWTTWAAA